MLDKTWQDIADFVEVVMSREGWSPPVSFYKTLGNQCLHIISVDTKLYKTSWINTAGGPITLVGNTVEWPSDMLAVDSVWYNGAELSPKQEGEMDYEDTGWRTATGTEPTYYIKSGVDIKLDISPTGSTGLLTVYGRGLLPDFSDSVGAQNPLEYIPQPNQLAPAYYILANIPIDVKDENQVYRVKKYEAMWAAEHAALVNAFNTRKYEAFMY